MSGEFGSGTGKVSTLNHQACKYVDWYLLFLFIFNSTLDMLF